MRYSMIRLLLVDDQAALRHGLAMRLAIEKDIVVIGEASNGKEAIDLASSLAPDVVLMDIEMPVMDGIKATHMLRNVAPACAVVILSIHDDGDTRQKALNAGAFAFVGKYETIDLLLSTIREAGQGKVKS